MNPSMPNILLIEDSAAERQRLREIIEPHGLRVRCCGSAAAAWEEMHIEQPDLVITEIMLEALPAGLHLKYAMREDERLRNIPIIVLTGVSRDLGLNLHSAIGTDYLPADAFLEKPVDAEALLATIRRLTGNAPPPLGR